MATATETLHAHDSATTEPAKLDKLAPMAGLIALIGLVLFIALTVAPGTRGQMLGSYVIAFYFWSGITLGCFGLTTLHHALNTTWGSGIVRLLEAGGGWRTLLWMGVLFIPLGFDVAVGHQLYEWTHAEVVAQDPILSAKTWYLNAPRFIGFAVVAFLLWITFSKGMQKSLARQEALGEGSLDGRVIGEGRMSWGAVGIVMFVLTTSFAFIDWGMSLEPHWFSSMYPVWNIVNAGLGALALVTCLLCLNAHRAPFDQIVSPKLTKDLGNLLFAFTMLWGYTSISQYLIIWNGNIPEFTQYFVRRSNNYWNGVGMALIIGQFLIPWFALLAPRTKKTPERLAKVAGFIFVMHILDVYYIMGPAVPFRQYATPMPSWTDVIAFLFVGAVWVFAFCTSVRKASLLPAHDRRLEEMKHAH